MAEPEVLTMTVVEAATALRCDALDGVRVRAHRPHCARCAWVVAWPCRASAIDELLAGSISVRANPIGHPDEPRASSSVER